MAAHISAQQHTTDKLNVFLAPEVLAQGPDARIEITVAQLRQMLISSYHAGQDDMLRRVADRVENPV